MKENVNKKNVTVYFLLLTLAYFTLMKSGNYNSQLITAEKQLVNSVVKSLIILPITRFRST